LDEDVDALLPVVEGAVEVDALPVPVDACAPELPTVLVGIEVPILPPSSAAVRANSARKSTNAAVGLRAGAVAATGHPAWEQEFIEVR
jgi:hypothetical protein